ncbi:hypothetical protein [Psychrobacillus sp. FSL K6-1415]|uniref:hypothetical protein n=1 Tax=Psychrobacillus sp. FSL K6-1415 TaxID=2921544 RepID=UPI0030F67A54
MSNQEELNAIMKKLAEVNKRTGFIAREIEVDKDGAMLLDPNNPNDVEWYENDEAYDIVD